MQILRCHENAVGAALVAAQGAHKGLLCGWEGSSFTRSLKESSLPRAEKQLNQRAHFV